MRVLTALAIGCVLMAPVAVQGQFSPGARSVGMGGAGMVYASGLDAIEWNPANLALDAGWSVGAELGGAGLINGATCDELMAILSAGSCDRLPWQWDLDATSCSPAIVSALPSSGAAFSSNSEGFTTAFGASAADLPQPGSPVPTLGVTVGSFGVRARSRVMTDATMSKELLSLMCEGFDPARIQEYAVGNTGFQTTSFSEFTGAYGATIGARLAIGVGVRYVVGHSLTRGRFFEPTVDLVNETIEVTGVAVESRGGSGYGLDVGVALDLVAGLRVSVSGTNVVQKMTWDEDLSSHVATFVGCADGTASCPGGDDFGDLDFADFLDRFEEQPIDPDAVSLPVYQTAADLFAGSYFPTVFRGGVGWRNQGTSVELVGVSVSPRGRQRNDWDERVSLGLEQRLGFMAFRVGGAKGSEGLQVLSAGVGFGFGPVALDVSGGFMSGGFDLTSGVLTPEDVSYDGAHLTLSLQVRGGGR